MVSRIISVQVAAVDIILSLICPAAQTARIAQKQRVAQNDRAQVQNPLPVGGRRCRGHGCFFAGPCRGREEGLEHGHDAGAIDDRAQDVETGYVPNGAPWQPGCGGGVAWGAAMNIMPYEFYLQYGDLDMLAYTYEGMKGYIDYMLTWTDDNGVMFSQREGSNGEPLRWFNLGDWVAPFELPPDDLVHTFYLWRCTDFTAKAANIHPTLG